MNHFQAIKDELHLYEDHVKAEFPPRYFRVCPGGYGEGDMRLSRNF